MKVIVAPDSFKGCLSSKEVCIALEKGIKQFDSEIEVIKFPSSDGGEGFCDCMQNLYGGDRIKLEVTSPLDGCVCAEYVLNKENDTAYIEYASAAGLTLVPQDCRDILSSTSYGVGELIIDAIARGAKCITLGLGGSATNDCGMGILSAFGVKFLDENCSDLEPIPANLGKVCALDKSQMLDISGIEFIAACDVKNPLCGKYGAAKVFAPQKGATLSDVEFLDSAAFMFAEKLGINPNTEGYGAAGGAGMALMEFFNAKYVSGAELLVKSKCFSKALDNADLLITGEGNTDAQSLYGKLVGVVINAAKEKQIKTIVISGGLSEGHDALGAYDYFSLCEEEYQREYAITHASELIENKALNAIQSFLQNKRNGA